MKLLQLTRYGPLGASSRMRTYQYRPWLAAAGIEATCAPLFSDAYVRALQEGRKDLREAVGAYARRVRQLLGAGGFDLVWIEKDALPWVPAGVERLLTATRAPYVLDYDDAVFHQYDENRRVLVRRLLGDKHPRLMRNARMVTAGNPYLTDFARRAGAPDVRLVPTVIDLDRYPPRPAAGRDAAPEPASASAPTIGWVGQRVTARFLEPLAPLFRELSDRGVARFQAIGIDARALGLPMESIPWTEATEADDIARLDVGIMPLADAPFERGKCGYKLIQYMACGLPVVASPVGVNADIVEHGVNGFLASTPAEWRDALTRLAGDADLRRRLGAAGRRKVEETYCIQVTGPRLAGLLLEAARNPLSPARAGGRPAL